MPRHAGFHKRKYRLEAREVRRGDPLLPNKSLRVGLPENVVSYGEVALC